jgi:hypothetical protein
MNTTSIFLLKYRYFAFCFFSPGAVGMTAPDLQEHATACMPTRMHFELPSSDCLPSRRPQ